MGRDPKVYHSSRFSTSESGLAHSDFSVAQPDFNVAHADFNVAHADFSVAHGLQWRLGQYICGVSGASEWHLSFSSAFEL